MANYYCTSRTNYFRVKDASAFQTWADKYGFEVVSDQEGRFSLLPSKDEDSGAFPSTVWNKKTEEHDDFFFMDELAEHLATGSVAVIVEAGAEKSRYVTGFANAVNSDGKTCTVSIDAIYKLAEKQLGGEVTRAEY